MKKFKEMISEAFDVVMPIMAYSVAVIAAMAVLVLGMTCFTFLIAMFFA